MKACQDLLDKALALGAADARIVDPGAIPVDDRFAAYCKDCPGFGRSVNCPPATMGPAGFRRFKAGFDHALVFKFDIPWTVLVTEKRTQANRRLHETTAALERYILESGWERARGFAAGGCKDGFCPDDPACAALAPGGSCRFPDQARPSLSGMGLDFKALSDSLGWPMETRIPENPHPDDTGMVAGMVLFR